MGKRMSLLEINRFDGCKSIRAGTGGGGLGGGGRGGGGCFKDGFSFWASILSSKVIKSVSITFFAVSVSNLTRCILLHIQNLNI